MTGAIVVTDESTLRRIVAESVAPLQTEIAAIRATLQPPTSPLIGPIEFAKLLGVNVRTLHRMELAGDVPKALRIGPKIVRWPRDVVDGFLRTGRVESEQKALSMRRRRG